MASSAVEVALDELYGVDPGEFVEVRKQLAAELRAAGDKNGAKELLAARRPTTAAWAVNQLARLEPDLVETFLIRSRELQTAQVGGGPGGREAIRDATRAHREALGAVADGALATLGERATDAYRSQILSTLHAASVDDAVGEQLRKGRLVREITGTTGFPDGPSLTLVPDLEQPVPPKQKRAPPKRAKSESADDAAAKQAAQAEQAERERLERERAAAAEREQQRAVAEAEWQVAQDQVAAAEAAAAEAHARVAQLEQDLDAARHAAATTEDRATEARREAARLARAAMKLQP